MQHCHPAIKTYDVRGPIADITPTLAREIGQAFALLTGADKIIVGHDMRPTSPELARCFADGARSAGANILWTGLSSTDQVYFASGALHLHAAVVTASHSPASDNGIKLTRPGATPVAKTTGLDDIHALLHHSSLQQAQRPGSITPPRRDDALPPAPPRPRRPQPDPPAESRRRRRSTGWAATSGRNSPTTCRSRP
jgi:phosphomannomutase